MHEVAIVHDYLTQRGGAERVVLALARAFPSAPIFTSVYKPENTFPEFRHYDVRTSVLNHVRPIRNNHRLGLPMYPFTLSRLEVNAQVVLSSSSGFAHGVRVNGGFKFLYLYTPPRWLYDQAGAYLESLSPAVKSAARMVLPSMRPWDRRAFASADCVATSSKAMAQRIRDVYGVAPLVVPPPPALTPSASSHTSSSAATGPFLTVGRLMSYKNVDAVVTAFRSLASHRLVVVGDGPEYERLAAMAGPNVEFVMSASDDELKRLYSSARGIISASYEDYGLTPLEGAAFGKPSVVLRFGGFLDTVREGETGVFFNGPTPSEIVEAVERFLDIRWDTKKLREHADAYSETRFVDRIKALLPLDDSITT